MKAGLLESADIIVVNKADRPGANAMVEDIKNMLIVGPRNDWWQIPVVTVEALENKGITELYDLIKAHREVMQDTKKILESQRYHEFIETLKYKFALSLWEVAEKDENLASYIAKVKNGEVDPYIAADNFMATFKKLGMITITALSAGSLHCPLPPQVSSSLSLTVPCQTPTSLLKLKRLVGGLFEKLDDFLGYLEENWYGNLYGSRILRGGIGAREVLVVDSRWRGKEYRPDSLPSL